MRNFISKYSIIGLTFLLIIIVSLQGCANKPPNKIDFLLDWKAESYFAPYYVAKEKGFYKEQNLTVNITAGKGAGTTAKLIGTGKHPLGSCSAPATIIARSQGVPVISVAVLYQESPSVILSLKKSDITKPKDLYGQTLGVRHYDISHQEYKAMMEANDLNRQRVKEVSIGWELQPLLTGKIDALYSYIYSQPVQVRNMGKKVNIVKMSDWGVKTYGSNIIANEKYAEEHPEIITRFLRASLKGWKFAIKHPEKAVEMYHRYRPETDKNLGLKMLKKTIPLLSGKTTKIYGLGYQLEDRWEKTQNLLFEQGVIDKKVKIEEVYTNRFIK